VVKIPQIVGMKDSHRDTATFLRLQNVVRGRIRVMVMARQSGRGRRGNQDEKRRPWQIMVAPNL
jgi:hypothetical protein